LISFYLFLDFLPVSLSIIILPTLRSNPPLVVGTRVLSAIFCFTLEMPKARFHEKLNPLTIAMMTFENNQKGQALRLHLFQETWVISLRHSR
jgi:hypothetical protein